MSHPLRFLIAYNTLLPNNQLPTDTKENDPEHRKYSIIKRKVQIRRPEHPMPVPIETDDAAMSATGSAVAASSFNTSTSSTPQSRRESLLEDLIYQSRRDLEAIAAAVSVGSQETVERLQQLEEDVTLPDGGVPEDYTETPRPVPLPPPPPPRSSFGQSLVQNLSAIQSSIVGWDHDRLVQVNMKNFSYFIPMKMDKPMVPTVFNQSVPYAAYEVIRRIHKYVHSQNRKPNDGGGDDQPERSSSATWTPTTMEEVVLPYAKRPVLKNINLALKPGRTYLVLGPPGCGKTSLLKAIADRLSYRGDSEKESLPNLPHREGRIEYNGVSTTVSFATHLVSLLALFKSH
jgi:ABC-type multidrug transport system fused ATPase/permease subunit